MHLLGICVMLVFLLFTNLASDVSRSDDYYYDYYYDPERTDEPVRVSTSVRRNGLRVSDRRICSVWETSDLWSSIFIRKIAKGVKTKHFAQVGIERIYGAGCTT